MKLTAYVLPLLALGAYAAPAAVDGSGASAIEARGPANARPPPPPPAPAQGGAAPPPRAAEDGDIAARDPQGRPPPRGGNRAGNGAGNGAGRPPPPPPNRRDEFEELE
ncbi:hypothetical protein INS49_011786 [Diaporthe citri]|uniref:uncharacterized protein n=1 Tax=Diaporthe citri TaxID=83186 RepID=UPI001C7FB1B5|nr:uncharacterized protein INS49_011786 [Diaporthe citri]KAG6360721.1 hypothetical protein INS49_011786 [Diaporthe citri]